MKLAIGLPSYRPVDPRVDLARMRLGGHLEREGIKWIAIPVLQEPFLGNVFNSLAHRFLASDCERLLVLDDDVVFGTNDVIKLARSDRDCVGGDYALKAPGAGMVSRRVPGGRVDGTHVECFFLGLGFSSFSRACIEKVAEMSPVFQLDERDADGGQICRALFQQQFRNGKRINDDVAFFYRVIDAGITPWLDTSITLGHVGTHVYTTEDA